MCYFVRFRCILEFKQSHLWQHFIRVQQITRYSYGFVFISAVVKYLSALEELLTQREPKLHLHIHIQILNH